MRSLLVIEGYSEKEKQTVVDFYLEHGKQIKYTLKTIGYSGGQH